MTRAHLTSIRTLTLACLLGVPGIISAQTSTPVAPPKDETLNINIFVGSAIDSFAAGDLRKYINPDDSGTFSEQLVAGFDFEYPIAAKKGSRLWLYGETTHGARSGEVDCSEDANAKKDACKIASLDAPSSEGVLAIFRKATSLEGFLGLRGELFEVGPPTARSAFYIKGQIGFLSVADKGGDVVDMHHVGMGLQVRDNSVFGGSYFELGYGRNDLFKRNHGRKLVDAYLTFGRPNNAKAKPFFQMVIDSDFASGPDNIQSFFGLNLDVLELFK